MNVVTQFPAVRAYDRDPLFQAMFEGAAIGIGICRLDGRILEANPALSRMLGYSQQELAGAQARELFPELRRDISTGNSSPDERRTDPGSGSAGFFASRPGWRRSRTGRL